MDVACNTFPPFNLAGIHGIPHLPSLGNGLTEY
jgi:hypothetical protein